MSGVGGVRGESAPGAAAPRCPATPCAAGRLGGQSAAMGACAAQLGQARAAPPGAEQRRSGWIMDGLIDFVSTPQGGIVGGNRLGTGKISD